MVQLQRSNGQEVMNATTIAQTLQRREMQRGHKVGEAYRELAGKLRIGAGAFERIARGRVKRIEASIRDRLQALLVRELEQEIMRLQNELEIARQGGAPLNSDQISEVETHLAKARATLSGGAT